MTTEILDPYTPLPESQERIVELVHEHEAAIAAMTKAAFSGYPSGEADGVSWHVTSRVGNSTTFPLIVCDLSDGVQVPMALRPDTSGFKDLYEKHPVVQRYFPHLYGSVDEVQEANGYTYGSVLLVERIQGYEGDGDPASASVTSFSELLNDPEHFEQLCQEMFEMADAVLAEPLAISDVGPGRGHNVMYNTITKHFQLFDTESITSSDKPYDAKFIDFITNIADVRNDKDITFFMRTLQHYHERYGKWPEYTEPARLGHIGAAEPGDVAGENLVLVHRDDPRYPHLLFSAESNGDIPQDKVSPETLKITAQSGTYTTGFKSDVLDAVTDSNAASLKELLINSDRASGSGNLINRTFTSDAA